MACKIIKETEIPGAVLPSEFDETGTVTLTLRVVEHGSKREAETYYAMKVNEYRACAAWPHSLNSRASTSKEPPCFTNMHH